jgi:hypothetical protein
MGKYTEVLFAIAVFVVIIILCHIRPVLRHCYPGSQRADDL